MAVLNLGDRVLYWRTDGDPAKVPLVLLNSLGTDQSLWEPVVAHLLDDFYVLRMDKRGHGGSTNVGDVCDMADLSRDVLAVMDAAGWHKAHVAGVSIGGMMGMWLGVHASERVERLVLSNTGAKMPTESLDLRVKLIRETESIEPIVDIALERFFTADFIEAASPLYHTLREVFRQCDPDGYLACCAAIRAMDQRGDVVRIQAPTLIINSTYDLSAPPALGEFLFNQIPDAELVEMPLAHLPMSQDPQGYAQILKSFLL